MTTSECHEWARTALSYRKAQAVSVQDGLNRTRPASADDSDYSLTLTMLTALAVASDKKEVTSEYDPLRESCAQLNRDSLVAVLAETGMTISAKDWNKWRPTKRTIGVIDGMPLRVTCVATDGNLGIFVTDAATHILGAAFLGHTHRFEWKDGEGEAKLGPPPALHSIPKATSEKPKVKKKRGPTRAEKLAML